MMKFIASIMIVVMTLSASADENEEAMMHALNNPIPTEAEANPPPPIPDPKVLQEGEPAPYEGLLLDAELFYYYGKKIQQINGCEAALIKQNDMLIDVQKQKYQIELERDKWKDNSQKKDTAIVIIMMIAAALVAGK